MISRTTKRTIAILASVAITTLLFTATLAIPVESRDDVVVPAPAVERHHAVNPSLGPGREVGLASMISSVLYLGTGWFKPDIAPVVVAE